MGEQLFLRELCQLINAEEKREIENHHENTTVIIVAGESTDGG